MSNHIVLAFAREHREELQKEWTDILDDSEKRNGHDAERQYV